MHDLELHRSRDAQPVASSNTRTHAGRPRATMSDTISAPIGTKMASPSSVHGSGPSASPRKVDIPMRFPMPATTAYA